MYLRSLCFFSGYVVITIVWGSLGVLLGWALPYRLRFRAIILAWTRMVLWWLQVSCHVRIDLKGLENIPDSACVVLSNHQSTLETLLLQSVLVPVTTVVKKQLLYIPFFGWAYALLKPISIRRDFPRQALKEVIRQGRQRLASGISVLIFPEGTRGSSGRLGKFHRSGPALALAASVPILPVVHNSGKVWRARQFLKRSGDVRFVIGRPIEVQGQTPKALTEQVRAWMQSELEQLDQG